MSQLIALIIAIALGAIVTAIGYVFLGDAFTKNSERGVALQFINQASQVEMAMVASRAENAKSGFVNNWTDTTDATVATSLVGAGYLKAGIVAPQGTYTLVQDADKNTFLVVDAADTLLSVAVCQQIEKLAGRDLTLEVAALPADAYGASTGVSGALNGSRYGCFDSTLGHLFAYEVE